MSAVFSILEGIVEAIMAIVGAIATVISAIIEVAPAVFGGIVAVAGAIPAVLQGVGDGLAAIPKVVQGIGQIVPTQIMAYVVWYVVEASIIAFFPDYALVITGAFFLFTIYGLLQGFGEILGAPTAVAAILAFTALAVNVYLVLAVV